MQRRNLLLPQNFDNLEEKDRVPLLISIAENESTTSDILKDVMKQIGSLAEEHKQWVLISIAKNRNITPDILEDIMKQIGALDRFSVLRSIAKNENISPDILKDVMEEVGSLAEADKAFVLEYIAENKSTTPDILEDVLEKIKSLNLESRSGDVTISTSENPIKRAVRREMESVIEAATSMATGESAPDPRYEQPTWSSRLEGERSGPKPSGRSFD